MPNDKATVLDSEDIDGLVAKIKEVEEGLPADVRESFDQQALSGLSGLSEGELQKFLEEQAGISPDEEAQGSIMAAAATIAIHC